MRDGNLLPGAFLVGFASPQQHVTAGRAERQILELQPCELAAPKCARKCGDVALMMMEYLASNGASNLTYLSGRRADGDDGYHAWCVVDGVAVDLTGNQFDEGRPAVFVGSAWDPWLATWSDRNPPLRYSDPGFASFAAPSLAMGYARIVEALNARRTSLR
ncbi:MAG: hypothetical protein EOP21_07485 [Hyphomicrobiales bacterium]|nr:MAG: hypothetical protein EOP21_07485 [Hyphomicrobiales bacterium]